MDTTTTRPEVGEKTCSNCLEAWPADLEFFYSGGKTKDGLMSECKACYNAWRRKPRPSSPEGTLTVELQGLFTRLIQKQEHKALTSH